MEGRGRSKGGSKLGRDGSKWRPGGSVGQWPQTRITLIRSRIQIRIEVKSWIRFRSYTVLERRWQKRPRPIPRILLIRQFSFRAFSFDTYFYSTTSPSALIIPYIRLQRLLSFECNYNLCESSLSLSISRPKLNPPPPTPQTFSVNLTVRENWKKRTRRNI